MTRSRGAAIAALLFVYLAVRLFWWYDEQSSTAFLRLLDAAGVLKIAIWVVPAIAFVVVLRRVALRDAVAYLGIDAAIPRGLRFGCLATLPLAVAALFAGPTNIDPIILVGTALVGPFAEEVLFRGFLLKTLLSEAKWPVGWAIAVSALAFAAAHQENLDMKIVGSFYQLTTAKAGLAQGRFLSMGLGLLVVGAGGAVFGWIFYRFGSLWPAVAFHGCMNLWLTLAYGDAGLEPVFGLVGAAQVISFVLAVLLTLGRRSPLTSALPARLS